MDIETLKRLMKETGTYGFPEDLLPLACAIERHERDKTMSSRRPGLWALQARQALELIAAPMRPDGTWNRDREACRQIAAEALGKYED